MLKFKVGQVFKICDAYGENANGHFIIEKDDTDKECYYLRWLDYRSDLKGCFHYDDVSNRNNELIFFKQNKMVLLDEKEALLLKLKCNW